MNKVTLYKIGANDQVLQWSIGADNNVLVMQYGQLDGAIQTKTEVVEVNQSGRDLDAQVALQLNSRLNKQIDKGYCFSIEEAKANKGLNSLNLLRPMLAKKAVDVKDISKDSWLQYKYNGHRCLITNIDGEYIAYSRNGKVISSIGHIVDKLSIPEGHTIDGELYHHGTSLQTIGSWIKRNQDDTKKLKFIAYDTILDKPYIDRLGELHNYGTDTSVIEIAPIMVYSEHSIGEQLDIAIDQGYEGLMIRQNYYGYDAGNRSKSLLKVKQHLDQEFLVINIHESKDGWAILECLLPNNQTFRVSAPGSISNKKAILLNKLQYIGKYINVEFFDWTNDNKPFHPVATYWR